MGKDPEDDLGGGGWIQIYQTSKIVLQNQDQRNVKIGKGGGKQLKQKRP